MTSPVRDEDRLDVNVSDTAVIDLASLATIGGGGQTRFSCNAVVLCRICRRCSQFQRGQLLRRQTVARSSLMDRAASWSLLSTS